MYRWQTLTLARLEAKASQNAVSTRQLRAAKSLLLTIGIQHFFEPKIAFLWHGKEGPSSQCSVWLTWTVDERQFRAIIEPTGETFLGTTDDDWSKVGTTDLFTTAQQVQDAVQFMLFGEPSLPQPCSSGMAGGAFFVDGGTPVPLLSKKA